MQRMKNCEGKNLVFSAGARLGFNARIYECFVISFQFGFWGTINNVHRLGVDVDVPHNAVTHQLIAFSNKSYVKSHADGFLSVLELD